MTKLELFNMIQTFEINKHCFLNKNSRRSLLFDLTILTWLAAKNAQCKEWDDIPWIFRNTSNYISHGHKKKPTCGIVKHFLLKEGHLVYNFKIMGIIQLVIHQKVRRQLRLN